jgi:hypothetical protein
MTLLTAKSYEKRVSEIVNVEDIDKQLLLAKKVSRKILNESKKDSYTLDEKIKLGQNHSEAERILRKLRQNCWDIEDAILLNTIPLISQSESILGYVKKEVMSDIPDTSTEYAKTASLIKLNEKTCWVQVRNEKFGVMLADLDLPPYKGIVFDCGTPCDEQYLTDEWRLILVVKSAARHFVNVAKANQ